MSHLQPQSHSNAQTPPPIHTECPTCGALGKFHHVGEQHWPAAVAKATGLPETVQLYTCDHCHTTLIEQELMS